LVADFTAGPFVPVANADTPVVACSADDQDMENHVMGNRNSYALAAAALAIGICGLQQSTLARQAPPKTFSSAGEGAHALAEAVQNHDDSAVEAILGVGRDVTSSGDESLDALEREQFARKYEEMHRLVREPNGATVLYIGAENWPFPIPLRSADGRWSFDAKAGQEEITYRRIGENETRVIETLVLIEETAPAEESRDGYWFKAVSKQTRTTDFAVGTTGTRASAGKNISGIQFVVYPIDYRSSGVMTFIVTEEGRVFEKDLGPDTATRALAIEGRVQAAGWKPVN
jgi:DUF2950 family protein